MENAIVIDGKMWFFSNGDVELEARIERGDRLTTFSVKHWRGEDAKYMTPDGAQHYINYLSSFATTFMQLGFDVTVRGEIRISDLRPKS